MTIAEWQLMMTKLLKCHQGQEGSGIKRGKARKAKKTEKRDFKQSRVG